ncbi:hypothetical protein E2C01_077328 [Portunus trituberculatus]|uniref:Uncharacterized protein n=1 Tax=Portunus trituberculatus TaxID=210409 RepID=A0A5B7IB66_PORTR|nr:hypothetical protein [Portunus trituberculatus]
MRACVHFDSFAYGHSGGGGVVYGGGAVGASGPLHAAATSPSSVQCRPCSSSSTSSILNDSTQLATHRPVFQRLVSAANAAAAKVTRHSYSSSSSSSSQSSLPRSPDTPDLRASVS